MGTEAGDVVAEREWSTGPVVITGASGQVGTALRARLAGLPNEVRALRRGDDVATASVGASAVVHLAGALFPRRPDTYQSANLDTVRATVTALKDSGVRRVVFLSYLGADETSTNPYLRYKAHAEGLIRASGIPAVVFRAAHIFGTPDAPGPTVTEMLSSGDGPSPSSGRGPNAMTGSLAMMSPRPCSTRRWTTPPRPVPSSSPDRSPSPWTSSSLG